MNKYEYTRILAERAKQLENGATPTVDITGLDDALRIAQKELREGVIPLTVRRRENNGGIELEDEIPGESDGDQSERGSGNDSVVDGEVPSESEDEGEECCSVASET